MKEIRYRICKYVEANKHLLVADPATVVCDGTQPQALVCLEAIIEVEEKQ
jgi:hypothetical protein